MLHREIGEQATLGEYTHVIQVEIDRVDRLIEQLLVYARPVPRQRGPVDVTALLDRDPETYGFHDHGWTCAPMGKSTPSWRMGARLICTW
jgi:hypothetical protein